MIRDATARDAAGIAAIWNPVIRDTSITFNSAEKTEADIAGLIADRQAAGHAFLLAEEAGRIAGFASYAQFRAGTGYGRTMEHTILLDPVAQGRGLGRALMRALEDHARAAGMTALIGGVSAENSAGRAFHARMGFAEVAILQRVGFKFGRTMDLVLMQKFLA
ncbi:GNAT family N-acetyltransferase [Tabrizicola sp. TH137]|uniref:GNAT family N-acetyltransferase n=1 Tax=Tabrizicola sp. TH137 TaxID=2067452 RepID=UPI000C7A5472|nr:GNAT family N-acetyltransferase [Tabrizicola sp. TH137]PLL11448.1 GNAT family N-acetyltransferase [Tabrizicola sp. TH137]